MYATTRPGHDTHLVYRKQIYEINEVPIVEFEHASIVIN